MGLLNLDKVKLSLESKLQRKTAEELKKERKKKEKGFHIVADLLIDLLKSGLLNKLDDEPIVIAECNDGHLLCIYENCIKIKDNNDCQYDKLFRRGWDNMSKEVFYKLAEQFDLTPESIQELLDLLGYKS